jgi:antitoxin YefM
MRIISFSDARDNLGAVIDQAVKDADVTVIARPDGVDAVVMSLDSYSSLMETMHLLGTPANAAHLARSLAQVAAGQVQRRTLIDLPDAEEAHAKPEVRG